MTARRICIVTPGYISATPRVVREADALATAGYDVRVVFTQGQLEHLHEFDRDTLAGRRWRASVYDWSNRGANKRWAYHRSRIRHHVARAFPPAAWSIPGVVERAEGRIYPELARLAAEEPADLFIGHYPTGLAAAAYAATRHQARLGYDVEDLYPDIYPASPQFAGERDRVLALEQRYVGACSYISAVSSPAADVFAERFGRERPIVIHNCHPLSDRKTIDQRIVQRKGTALSLYWFSQTIGLNRGLQDVIRAAGLVKIPIQLHVQGHAEDGVKHDLQLLAAECGVPSLLHFHAPVPPDELPSRAAEHHIGLALETADTLNRKLAVTNKLFLYFISGLAVLASDLPGQRSVLSTAPEAGFLYPTGDFCALASHLDFWARHPRALEEARRAATRAADETWNWEREGGKIVEVVARLFDERRDASSTLERRVS